jgi:hypothetical protein
MNYEEIFDAWEPLLKARKAKGLDKWTKLQPIAEKLSGKDIKAIQFTCAHPSHAGEPVKHLLGSVEGNLHFMLGYGNPAFHLAPYHWMIIDPNTTPEEAEEMFTRAPNPSNPALWAKAGIQAGDEGDLAEGEPAPTAKQAKIKQVQDSDRQAESVKGNSPTGSYTCVPSEGLIYGDHNGHVYRWDLVKDTFFSAFNPQVTEAMNAASVQKSQNAVRFRSNTPDTVRARARLFRDEDFAPDVWALVKSRVSRPGSVVRLETVEAESAFGVVTPDSIEFYGRDGTPCDVRVHDRVYKSFDLKPQGNVPPSALLSFIVGNFGVNASLLSEITATPQQIMKSDSSVEGDPSPGWDDVPAEFVEGLNKSIVVDSDVVRLVIT